MEQLKSSKCLQHASSKLVRQSRASLNEAYDILGRAQYRIERARNPITQAIVLERLDVVDVPSRVIPKSKPAEHHVHDLFEVVQGRIIESELIRLDGKHFIDCMLKDCTLEFGGSAVILETTEFTGCKFRFTGYAAMTVQLLECFGMKDNAPEYTKSMQGQTPNQRLN